MPVNNRKTLNVIDITLRTGFFSRFLIHKIFQYFFSFKNKTKINNNATEMVDDLTSRYYQLNHKMDE